MPAREAAAAPMARMLCRRRGARLDAAALAVKLADEHRGGHRALRRRHAQRGRPGRVGGGRGDDGAVGAEEGHAGRCRARAHCRRQPQRVQRAGRLRARAQVGRRGLREQVAADHCVAAPALRDRQRQPRCPRRAAASRQERGRATSARWYTYAFVRASSCWMRTPAGRRAAPVCTAADAPKRPDVLRCQPASPADAGCAGRARGSGQCWSHVGRPGDLGLPAVLATLSRQRCAAISLQRRGGAAALPRSGRGCVGVKHWEADV